MQCGLSLCCGVCHCVFNGKCSVVCHCVLKRVSASGVCHCGFKRISAVWSVIVCLTVSAVWSVIVCLRG